MILFEGPHKAVTKVCHGTRDPLASDRTHWQATETTTKEMLGIRMSTDEFRNEF
jgi:hypothetical protein